MTAACAPPQVVSMRTRDGVRLDADVYRPGAPGPFPVLLMRQPYGRRIASTVCYAHPQWYAAQGYIVVIQDVRGRGTSEGKFDLFVHEAADGADAVAWAAALPGSNGNVGMYGFSYQGTAQLLAAPHSGPALKALAPAMIGWDLRNDWAYENDAFRLRGNLGWAVQIGAETARLAGDAAAFAELYAASRAPSFASDRPGRPDFIERQARYTHYHDWLARRDDETYWRPMSPAACAAAVDLPMLFVGGWYDTHLPGTIAAFRYYETSATAPTRLVVGPWAHLPWGRFLAGRDFGAAAASDIDLLQVCWFDHWLKGRDNNALARPPVRLFEMGSDAWRDFATWPEERKPVYLTGDGRASIDALAGRLSEEVPARAGVEWLVHDPWRPVPAIGCADGVPPGPVDRAAVDARGDVQTFTTAPFERECRLGGEVSATLWVACDAASFDVSCTLSRVARSGQVLPLTHGYRHVTAGKALRQPLPVPMSATCASIAPGEALRLSIAAACFPAYPVNPGTGRDPADAFIHEATVITLGIRTGGENASFLTLPVVGSGRWL